MAYARSVQGVWHSIISENKQYYNECNIPTQKNYAFYVHKRYTSGGTLLLSLYMIKTPPSEIQNRIKFVVNLKDIINGVTTTGTYNASISTNGGEYVVDVRTVSGTNLAVTGYAFSCPVFSKQSDIDKYIATGDDSGRELNINTDWKLYIDGKSNPLYKLTWNCDGLKNVDTEYTTISIWVGTYNALDDTFNDDDGTKFKEVEYDNHSVKFSYADLEKLVPQPLIGHNPPSIRVQLA